MLLEENIDFEEDFENDFEPNEIIHQKIKLKSKKQKFPAVAS